jgi:hypothetical protein
VRTIVKTLTVLTWIVLLPTAALAQAVIAGIVKDASGAILPGVGVEAASPALIEKVRNVVTDGTGQYRIEDLRPGTYTVTFTLQGFSTYKREGIELTGTFTATVNADLKVGTIAETITVTGETPVVDVKSAERETTLNTDVVRSIPTVRSYNAMVVLVPGVVTNLNDVVTGTSTTQFPIYGGRSNEGRLTIDGLNVGNPPGGNQPPGYSADIGNAQEVTYLASGGLGETETGGMTMNLIPKTGGNSVSGAIFGSFTGASLQGNNLTAADQAAGLSTPLPLTHVYDVNGSVGGPIAKDRVWYFVNARTQGNRRQTPLVDYNVNAGDPNAWLYVPNPSQPEYSDRTWENASGRLTWQVTPRNKIAGFWDEQVVCRSCTGSTSGITDPTRVSPEAVGAAQTKPLRYMQATWSSPVTNKLLLDAGFGGVYYGWGNFERSPNPTANLVQVTEQCAGGCAANGGIPNLVYRSQNFGNNRAGSYSWRASASYVTGRQSLKIGYQGTLMTDYRTWATNNQNLAYRFSNGVPNQLTEYVSPWVDNGDGGWHALFVQDVWTLGRLTLQGALRFDRSTSWFPAQQEGPSKFLSTPFVFPLTEGVNSYKDLTPRMGVTWDVFGNGKSAVKVNLGRYLEGAGVSNNWANSSPVLRLPGTVGGPFAPLGVTRTWTDANGNFVPDCNLQNPAAQDLRGSGGDFCGAISNGSFGQTTLTNGYDPALLNGWGVRAGDWDLGVSLQQQILPRASIQVAYIRRWYQGFTVSDNTLTAPSDYTTFSITTPQDPRLPGGGGQNISGLYDVNPNKFGQVFNYITDSSGFGREYAYFNGLDFSVNVRTSGGLSIQGGTSTGQNVADACAALANDPELNVGIGPGLVGSTVRPLVTGASGAVAANPYCHVAYGVLTQGRGLVSYVIPKIDLQLSSVFQSKPGALLAANYNVPVAAVLASLGRPLSGNAPFATVNLVPPGSQYGDRINELDFRVAKLLRVGHTKTMVALDLYNALNSSATLTYNSTFVPGGTWNQPITVLTARLAKISAELTW